MKHLMYTGMILAAGLALTGSANAAADLKIGIAGPLTGAQAAFGKQLTEGTEQAIADLNAKGGILGHKLTFEEGDDQADPKQGVSVANKFVGDGIKWVVGHFDSGVSIPASDVYKENGMLAITPASTNPQLTDRPGYWNVFRTCGRDDQQGLVAANYIKTHMKGEKIAILDDKTTYGKGLADVVRAQVKKNGGSFVLDDEINAGEKDYSAEVTKIKASGAQVVYYGGYQTEAGLLIRQMHEQGVKAIIFGADGIATDEYAQIGGDATIGTLMTFGPDATKSPAAKAVVKEFAAKKYNPEAYTLYAYAAVQVLDQAAVKAKSIDPKKVAAAIHSGMKFHTVIGNFTYDKKGDRKDLDYVVYTWQKTPSGKITYVQNAHS